MFRDVFKFAKVQKSIIVFTALTIVLSYGFYATHYSIHIDQLVTEYYNGTALIGAGRWAAPVIHWLTNWMNFAPFWHTMIMGVLLLAGAVCWSFLFKKASNDHLSDFSLIAFSVIFVSYPVIEAQITYPILNIVLSYSLVAVSLILQSDSFLSIKKLLVSLALLVISVDMYESFAAVYLVGLFSVIIIKFLYDEGFSKKFKDIFLFALKPIIILILAIAVDFLISKLICFICCGTTEFWYANNTRILWFDVGLIDNAIWLIRLLFAKYFILGFSFPCLFLNFILELCGLIFSIYYVITKKTLVPAILFIGLSVSVESLSLIVGYITEFTQDQTLAIFAAFMIMIIADKCFVKRRIQTVFSVVLVLLTVNQAKTINNYSVDNYERSEYELDLLRDVGKDLLEYDEEKPVVFYAEDFELPDSIQVSRDDLHPLFKMITNHLYRISDRIIPESYFIKISDWYNSEITDTKELSAIILNSQAAYRSFISWADYSSHFYPNIYRAMNRLGYSYKACSQEQYNSAKNYLIENNETERYEIIDTGDFIIVQFM